MRNVVCYHYPCPDGIYAALSAHEHFARSGTPVHWSPLTTFKPPSVQGVGIEKGDTVYFLDYTGPAGFPEQVAKCADRVVVLDHHKTAQDDLVGRSDLPNNIELHIDMDRSGATIARDYFKSVQGEDVMRCIEMIEDGDLWRWRLPHAKAFYAGLKALGLEYDANKNPAIFDTLLNLNPDELIATGHSKLEEEERLLYGFVAEKRTVCLGGAHGEQLGWGQCFGVWSDSPDLPLLRSELGNRLAIAAAAAGLRSIGVVAYPEVGIGDDEKVKVSLRGRGDVDTTTISRHFGGGGHALASSCIVSKAELQTWWDHGASR